MLHCQRTASERTRLCSSRTHQVSKAGEATEGWEANEVQAAMARAQSLRTRHMLCICSDSSCRSDYLGTNRSMLRSPHLQGEFCCTQLEAQEMEIVEAVGVVTATEMLPKEAAMAQSQLQRTRHNLCICSDSSC